jgi:HD-GYP domain-containing protein (c-di-GMP phosphodiesterase class II)
MTMLAGAPWMAQAVQALALELRLHHTPTAEHSHRLAAHARMVAEDLRLDALDATEVELVAVLHDVGKLAVDPTPSCASSDADGRAPGRQLA